MVINNFHVVSHPVCEVKRNPGAFVQLSLVIWVGENRGDWSAPPPSLHLDLAVILKLILRLVLQKGVLHTNLSNGDCCHHM